MSDDLTVKENEFRKLNRELQYKTRDVMKEINSIIHTCASNNLLSSMNQLQSDSVIKMSQVENVRVDKQLRTSLSKPVEIDNAIENLQKKDKGNKAIIALFQSKIDMLYKELQTLQLEYNKMVILDFLFLITTAHNYFI